MKRKVSKTIIKTEFFARSIHSDSKNTKESVSGIHRRTNIDHNSNKKRPVTES